MTTPTPADPKPGELWRHWMGGLYTVLEICRATWDADLRLVAYDAHMGDGTTWIRPLSEWHDIMSDGTRRFEKET